MQFEIVRDDRGRTYIAKLRNPLTLSAYETATHVMIWYHRYTRDWVVSYSSDARGTQVGGSDYVYSREDANDIAAYLYSRA